MSEANTTVGLAVSVLAIYVIFGPIILLSIYAFFDRLAEKQGRNMARKNHQDFKDKNPALWTGQDVRKYLKQSRQ